MKRATSYRLPALRPGSTIQRRLSIIRRTFAAAIDRAVRAFWHNWKQIQIRSVAEPLEVRVLLAANLLDTSFGGGDGIVTTDVGPGYEFASAITVLADGRILAAGVAPGTTSAAGSEFALVRYKADGTRDTTFGGGDGIVTLGFGFGNDAANAIAVLPSGKILVAGTATVGKGSVANTDFALARFNADGSVDSTFGGGDGRVTTPVGNSNEVGRAILTLADGDILVAGRGQIYTPEGSEIRNFAVVRYNANGTLDSGFGGGDGIVVTDIAEYSSEEASALARGPNGSFYVGGVGDSAVVLTRYKPDGTLDATFSDEGIATYPDYFSYSDLTVGLATLSEGDVLIAGNTGDYTNVLRFNADGSLETAFGSEGRTQLYSGSYTATGAPLAVMPDGKIVVGTGAFSAARLTADGFADPTFDGEDGVFTTDLTPVIGNYESTGGALALTADGRIVTAGRIRTYSSAGTDDDQFSLVRLKNVQSTAPQDTDDQLNEATILTVGAVRNGAIDSGTDVDMYKVNVVAGQRLDLDIDRPAGSNLDSILRVFDRFGNEMQTNDDAPAPGEAAGGTDSYLRQFFLFAGTYYVGVSGSVNGSYSPVDGTHDIAGTAGAYTLRVTNVPQPPDADDQIAEAPAIGIADAPRAGKIATDLDVNLVKVSVAAGQRVGFDVDVQGTSKLNSYLRLFKSDGTELAASDDSPAPGETSGTESYFEYLFSTAGTYYVGVSASGNSGYDAVTGRGDFPAGTGAYTLDLVNVPNPDADDQFSEAVTIVPSIRGGAIENSTDVDMFKLTATAGNFIQLDLDRPVNGTLDSILRLFDSEGNELAFSYNDPAPGEQNSTDSYIEFTVPTTGTYYVGVSGEWNRDYSPVTGYGDNPASKGVYQLSLKVSPAAPNRDADDQISEAKLLGAVAVNAAIDGQKDVDMYALKVAATESVELYVSNASVASYLRLFDSGGTELAYKSYYDSNSDPSILYTFTTAGTYYLGVSGSWNAYYDPSTGNGDSDGSTGTYRLNLRRLPIDADDQIGEAKTLAAGAEVDGVVSTKTDVDMYAIKGVAGEEWNVAVSTPLSDLAPTLRMFDADGNNMAATWLTDSSLRFGFAKSGTYYFGISGSGNDSYNPITGLEDYLGITGTYHISVRKLSADPDDQIREARQIALGTTRSDSISPRSSDVDMYWFQGVAGKAVAIDLDRPAGGIADAVLRLFNANGDGIETNQGRPAPDEQPNAESYIDFVPSADGMYYVGVSSSGNPNYNPLTGDFDSEGGTSGAYSLTVRSFSDPDDQFAEAVNVPIGSVRADAISDVGDVDMIKFTVPAAGQRIAIDLDRPAGSSLDSVMRLFDASGNELSNSDDTPAPGERLSTESYLEYVFSKPGTYYVGVSSHNNSVYDPWTGVGKRPGSTMGAYTLRISRLA